MLDKQDICMHKMTSDGDCVRLHVTKHNGDCVRLYVTKHNSKYRYK